ncbi:MAG: HAD hydrolase family protein [Treponema sp.]|jgi:Cof subfamily protein (haloacid dehalogenase superfamily)|nr:HAD hydrolase family protein [Treponema sp.]
MIYTGFMQNSHNPLGIDPAKIKAFALDLDGTCLGRNGSLSGRTIRSLKTCLHRGIQVIICTGRSIDAAEPYRVAIGAEGPMVYFNGAEVVDMPSETMVQAALLSLEAVDYCVDLSRSRGLYYQVYFPGTPEHPRGILMAERQTQETEMYRIHTGIQAVIGDLKQALAQPGLTGCVKGMFISEPWFHEDIRAQLVERFGQGIYIARTLRTFLEIMDAAVSKGRGLRCALAYQGLQDAPVIAFGDEENDLPLFEAATYAAAPANAKELVLRAADFQFGPNTEDGLAAWLEQWFG